MLESYGPNPWQQAHWDWRAAGNFIGGGAGAGLVLHAALSGAGGLTLALLLLAGLALVAGGLACVWLEIGRPLRALNVLRHPRRSWMSREAIVASLLLPVGLAAALWAPGLAWPAATLALAFVYCQARMLRAARGIPAWREPRLTALVLCTGLAEGAGLMLALQPAHTLARPLLLTWLAVLLLARAAAWLRYRTHAARATAAPARAALDTAGRWLLAAGTMAPLAALLLLSLGLPAGRAGEALGIAAGLAIAGSGAWFKFTLITRAAFNQGFALTHLPVRGAQR